MASFTKTIAAILQLPNPSEYTSHTIRRSGTSVLVNKDFTEVELMNSGRWKNANSCRKYQKISECTKLSIADAFTTSDSLAMIKSPPIVLNQCKSTASLQPCYCSYPVDKNVGDKYRRLVTPRLSII